MVISSSKHFQISLFTTKHLIVVKRSVWRPLELCCLDHLTSCRVSNSKLFSDTRPDIKPATNTSCVTERAKCAAGTLKKEKLSESINLLYFLTQSESSEFALYSVWCYNHVLKGISRAARNMCFRHLHSYYNILLLTCDNKFAHCFRAKCCDSWMQCLICSLFPFENVLLFNKSLKSSPEKSSTGHGEKQTQMIWKSRL